MSDARCQIVSFSSGGLRVGARVIALLALLAAQTTPAAMVRGVVTGDVDHMPWRKGTRELGWCTVKAYRDGILLATTRTNTKTGDFELGLPPGELEIVVSRPGFITARQAIELGDRDVELKQHLRPDPDYGLIAAPRTGTAFTAGFNSDMYIECLAPPTARQWSVSLATEHFKQELEMRRVKPASTVHQVQGEAEFGSKAVWNGTRAGWRLCVLVPTDTPPELYDLVVGYTDRDGRRHESRQAKAVHVVPFVPTRFRVMPYCDFHLNWLVHKRGAEGEAQADFFKAASLLDPLFVSLGDDVGFEGDDHVAMFHHLVSQHLDVPVYLAFGNHDGALGVEGHEFYFGPRWQHRRLGPSIDVILSYDLYQANYQMPDEQRRWVNEMLARLDKEPANELIFLAGHLSPWKPPTPFFKLPFTKQTRTFFPGHNDGRLEVEFQRLFMHALSVGSMHGWAGLNYTGRVVEIESRKRATLLPQFALPTIEFDKPNNGTATTNTATIRLTGLPAEKWAPPEKLYTGGYFCDLPKAWKGLPEIRHARLRFVMARGRYRTSAGRIWDQVDGGLLSVTVVYLSVDVTQPVLKITVSPAAVP